MTIIKYSSKFLEVFLATHLKKQVKSLNENRERGLLNI